MNQQPATDNTLTNEPAAATTDGQRVPPGQIIETRVVRLQMGEDGVVRQKTLDVEDYSVEDAKAHVAATGRVTGGKRAPILADIRGVRNAGSAEIREYYASEEGARYTAALGMVVESALTRIVANLYFRIDRPPYPSRMFTNEEQALAWLKGFR